MPLSTGNIVDIITAIGVIITFFVAMRKTPHEVLGMDATTAQIYQNMVKEAAEQEIRDSITIKELKLRIDYLERQVNFLRKKLSEEKTIPISLKHKIEELEKQVEILKKVIVELGGIVPEFEENGI